MDKLYHTLMMLIIGGTCIYLFMAGAAMVGMLVLIIMILYDGWYDVFGEADV